MDAAQITELVLELYDARKEAKEYLDFFVQPDIDSKLHKARMAIDKEASRSSRGRARPRMTRVRRFIADISSLNPGAEPICEIMTYTVEKFARIGCTTWIKETTQKAVGKLVKDTVKAADNGGVLDLFLPRLQKAVDSINSDTFYSRDFRSLLACALEEAIASLTA